MRRVGGIVLCGGASTRMGRDKAWLPFAGELMLPRVVRLLANAVRPIVVVAAEEQQLPDLPADVVVARDERQCRGPLEGLAVGLKALVGKADAAYLASCDAPFLKPLLVGKIVDLLGENLACVPRVHGQYQPLAAVYRLEVLGAVDRLVEAGCGPIRLLDEIATRVVEEAEIADVDPGFQSLRNLNTPAEYEAALREVEQR